jgi:ferritin-like metal-binding protein YciE
MARGLGAKNVIELLERNLKEEKEALREVESAAKRLSKEPVAA